MRKQTRRRPGFTLAELLVVIGIILLLIAILIPTVSKVREAGMAADTRALLTAIDGAAQAYYSDHQKWPGPLPDSALGPGAAGATLGVGGTTGNFYRSAIVEDPSTDGITGTENLVLGLLGGLTKNGTGAIIYDPGLVGNGPANLGNTPGASKPYIDVVADDLSMHAIGQFDLSPPDGYANATTGDTGMQWGRFVDEGTAAQDSIIPEFVDRFTNPMPILYMRAQPTGFSGTGFSPDNIASATGAPYSRSHIAGYVDPTGVGSGRIGVGGEGNHGLIFDTSLDGASADQLRTSKDKGSANYTYPHDLRAFLLSESADEPVQKDRYILISAGADRVYGTEDDITNFGS